MIYQTFAQLYDELFDDQLYADWQSFVMQEVQAPGTLLDLGGRRSPGRSPGQAGFFRHRCRFECGDAVIGRPARPKCSG